MAISKYALLRSNPGIVNAASQRKSVETYSSKQHIYVTEWLEDSPSTRKALQKANNKLVKTLETGSWLVLSEISVLGPSFTIVAEILLKLLGKKIRTYSIKEKIMLDSKKLAQLQDGLAICKKIDKALIAQRISKGHAKRQFSGKSVGRPKGKKSIRTKLTGKEDEVRTYFKKGLSYTAIGKLLDVNRLTVKSFIMNLGVRTK